MKSNVKILVQGTNEFSEQFAERIEKVSNQIMKEHEMSSLNLILTSSSDGRQTATLQYFTSEIDYSNQAVFNGDDLKSAYQDFLNRRPMIKNAKLKMGVTDDLIEFLLKQTR